MTAGSWSVAMRRSGPPRVGVRDKFQRTQGGRAMDLDYLIYCPAHRLVGINAAALDPSRVVDATHRAQPPERLKVVVRPGGLVVTFNGLCARFLEERGQRLPSRCLRDLVSPSPWRRRACCDRPPAAPGAD